MSTTATAGIAINESETVPAETRDENLAELEAELMTLRKRVAALRNSKPAERVKEYSFKGSNGEEVTLSQLFGTKNELILIDNMGKGCPYCTLWADGFVGLAKHLETRASFVLTTPDDPETQRKFAMDRGWPFKMYSTQGTTFKHDMGFEPKPGSYWPGVSVFTKNAEGEVFHTTKAEFGPGDEFCSLWGFLDLLPGKNEWEPKFHYDK